MKPVTILVGALGGDGGGVLCDWIVAAAQSQGLGVQATQIPGVAQRTGATTYYLEVMPTQGVPLSVLALNPAIGEVDVALATELLEAGRMIFNGFVTPERYRQGVATIEDLCGRVGRDPSTIERGIFVFVGVDRNPLRARRQAEEFLSRNYAMPFAPFAPYIVVGAPNECTAGIRRYIEAGTSHVTVRFATAEPLRQLELWSEEVLPALREV